MNKIDLKKIEKVLQQKKQLVITIENLVKEFDNLDKVTSDAFGLDTFDDVSHLYYKLLSEYVLSDDVVYELFNKEILKSMLEVFIDNEEFDEICDSYKGEDLIIRQCLLTLSKERLIESNN